MSTPVCRTDAITVLAAWRAELSGTLFRSDLDEAQRRYGLTDEDMEEVAATARYFRNQMRAGKTPGPIVSLRFELRARLERQRQQGVMLAPTRDRPRERPG